MIAPSPSLFSSRPLFICEVYDMLCDRYNAIFPQVCMGYIGELGRGAIVGDRLGYFPRIVLCCEVAVTHMMLHAQDYSRDGP